MYWFCHRAALLVCVNVLTYRANTELPQKCKLTVMNAEQLRAEHCV